MQKNIPYLMGSTSHDMAPPIIADMAKNWCILSQSKTSSQATAGSLIECCQEITMAHGIPVNCGISLEH